ncbi:unnamed protein product [Paramecium primaurelia]|uniref:Uncharacterized protein n=1 Tax=Paramecium primaurelia TaxID=5886 RepID=A0A8S1M8Y1_PARPR|nr:unnamed protein product [Paramecium primaurelia]
MRWQTVQQNQYIKNDYILLSAEYQALIPIYLRRLLYLNKEISDLIVNQLLIIDENRQSLLDIQKHLNKQVLKQELKQIIQRKENYLHSQLEIYNFCYEVWGKLNQYYATIQTI